MSGAGAKLDGNEPSWVCYDTYEIGYDHSDHYTTNNGGALISPSGMLLECIYGIGRNMDSKHHLEVQINTNAFRVSTSKMTLEDELINHQSMSRSHAGRQLNKLPVSTVLETLLGDDNTSYAGITVKKTLLRLIQINCNLSRDEKQMVKDIKASWRKAITQETLVMSLAKPTIVRTPIVGIRKPILKGVI